MSETHPSVAVRVPAKINVQLDVGPLRPDGFHELRTVFHAVSLFDRVTARPASELSVRVDGPERDGVATDESNLSWRAAALLADSAGVQARVALQVTKNIPVAAGLAGGSADAAATLIACDRLWQLRTPPDELEALAARLGSDVGFALRGGTACGTGRGEILTPLAAGRFHWVLAAADGALSTPGVYREFDRLSAHRSVPPPNAPSAGLRDGLVRGDPAALADELSNDLQPAALALAPYLADTLRAGRRAGAIGGIVSGSGPTCAFLARDAPHAASIADELNKGGSCRFAVAVLGGVQGATVVD